MRNTMSLAPRHDIYGMAIQAVTRDDLEKTVIGELERDAGGWLLPANLEVMRQFRSEHELRRLLSHADVLVADGQPIVWASRIANRSLPERVAGSDLIFTLTARAAENGRSIFLLGGSVGAAEEAAQRLVGSHPGLNVAGTACPPLGFERSPNSVAALIEHVQTSAPDIVFVGLGFPKQERLIFEMRKVLPAAWFVSCGVSIDFAGGVVRRAPTWTHNIGLEWLYRLCREPRKLFRRYLVHGPPFAARLAAWAIVTRLRERGAWS
jgi:N-acetylglucosaminyldiphosphoundecaprenol N-acetyl-beta-D-mannosaminyltransferase